LRSLFPHPRAPRLPLTGRVRLMVDFAPWQLALDAEALNISETGILAKLLDSKDLGETDCEALLTAGDPFLIQIDHEVSHVTPPVIASRLRRRTRVRGGWELAFGFESSCPDVGLLVGELAQN
jgi:hypothetical protein